MENRINRIIAGSAAVASVVLPVLFLLAVYLVAQLAVTHWPEWFHALT